MDTGTSIALSAFGLNLIVLVVTVTWAVGKMSGTSRVLNASLSSLGRSIDLLRDSVDKIDGKVDDHGERIAVLEAIKKD